MMLQLAIFSTNYLFEMLQLVITYLWFGPIVPQQYLLRFASLTHPARLLINPVNNMTYELEIQKSDRYRLQMLKNGGVYADFDTRILYDCLMGTLENFKGEMMVPDFAGEDWKHKVNNNFIYVPPGNSSLVREILQKQGKDCGLRVTQCHGPEALQKYRDRITVANLDGCIAHDFEWSWGFEKERLQSQKMIEKIVLGGILVVIILVFISICKYSTKRAPGPTKPQLNGDTSASQANEESGSEENDTA